MNYIEHFEIEGFWGDKRVSLDLNEDINFLIGSNGSGKTTIINLISAALQADIPKLYSIQFKRILIRLKTKGKNKKPLIEVQKVIDPDTNNFELVFNVKQKTSEVGTTYKVEGPYEDRIFHDPRYPRTRRMREEGARLNKIMRDVVEVNWLSVHRSAQDIEKKRYREDDVEATVDVKIRELSKAFAQYFSFLRNKADKESESFQEYVFLSLLDQEREVSSLFAQVDQQPPDKSTVVGILQDLGVSANKANRSVSSHLSRLNNAKRHWEQNQSVTMEQAISLSDAFRVNEMVKKWRALQKKRDEIFQPRDQFESIINSLFSSKELHFDDRNIPKVHLEKGNEVDIGALSSGEKQLFILLGEAVLQEERPLVFISDEPELSLHVSWQSCLFQNIRNLNRSCQIISATHSPDIVGNFRDKVIKIDDCFI